MERKWEKCSEKNGWIFWLYGCFKCYIGAVKKVLFQSSYVKKKIFNQ